MAGALGRDLASDLNYSQQSKDLHGRLSYFTFRDGHGDNGSEQRLPE